jgi:hypothetical protein
MFILYYLCLACDLTRNGFSQRSEFLTDDLAADVVHQMVLREVSHFLIDVDIVDPRRVGARIVFEYLRLGVGVRVSDVHVSGVRFGPDYSGRRDGCLQIRGKVDVLTLVVDGVCVRYVVCDGPMPERRYVEHLLQQGHARLVEDEIPNQHVGLREAGCRRYCVSE